MWLLTILPHWIFYGILSTGIILGVGASIINLRSAQITGCLLVWISTWFIGGIENDRAWQSRVKDAEARVVIAEARAQVVNTEVITKTLTKIKLIKEITNANQKYIAEYVAQELDSICKLTSASIVLHNSASQNEVPGSSSNIVTGTSEIKASELLSTVTENYGTYYEVVEQLKAWQAWYTAQRKLYD